MPYSRQRPRVPPTGRITVRLTPAQRDLFIEAQHLPPPLAHALKHAPVREGMLTVRLGRESLGVLIQAAARRHAPDARAGRELDALLRYLETLDDRFEDPADASAADES